jgi:hypothetical protein
MSRRTHALLAGAAIALSAGAGLAAYAQPTPKAEPRIERHERTVVIRRGDGEHGRGEFGRDRAEHLRNILQLRPNQEAALTAYLAAGPPDHARMTRMDGEGPAKTTPERLARMEQHLAQHQAEMRAELNATRRFYDQLDPAQKRAFDELPLMMGAPGHMRMHPMRVMHRLEPLPPMPHMHGAPMPPAPPEPPEPPAAPSV